MQQLALSFEAGLASRYDSLRECLGRGIYGIGLSRVAGKIDISKSSLCSALSGERSLDIDVLENYVKMFDDKTPVLYLAAKFCQDKDTIREQALAQIPALLAQLNALMKATSA